MMGNTDGEKHDVVGGGGICITSKKIVAVALAAATCLSLSMTAFASRGGWSEKMWESEDYMREELGPYDRNGLYTWTNEDGSDYVRLSQVTDANGNKIRYSLSQISKGTWESINDEGKVHDIFAKAGYNVKDDMDFVPLATGTITVEGGMPEGGATLNFTLADMGLDSDSVKEGDVIYVMQETSTGVWEILPATVTRNPNYQGTYARANGGNEQYQISVTVPRNGALVVVKVMSNGDVITLDKTTGEIVDRIPSDQVTNPDNPVKPGGQTSTSNPASAGTSPKTGEF